MTVQDDARENELIELFQLRKFEGAGRGDTDAVLDLDGTVIPFELKSTTKGSVTTVRDFGPEHVRKWRDKHWLVGVYKADGRTLKYCLYGSPSMVLPWVQEKEEYVKSDFHLAELVPELLTLTELHKILGEKEVYTYEDAFSLQKRQCSTAQYRQLMDVPNGYSPARMLEFLKARCQYVLARGSTLNNPHIPAGFVEGWHRITDNHAARLRELVAAELRQAADVLEKVAQAAEESARETDSAT